MKQNKKIQRIGAAGVITTAAFITVLTYSLVLGMTNTIVNEIVDAFSLSGASEGLMGSMVSVGFMASLILIPFAQGRVKKLHALIGAGVLQTAMLFLSGASPVFTMFCVMCVFLGFSGGLIDSYANSSIVDVRGPDSPKYLSYMHGLFAIGSLATPLLIYRLLLSMEWRGIFYILAVLSILTALAVLLLTRGRIKGGISATTKDQRLTKADLGIYIRKKRNIMLSLAAFFSMIFQSGLLSWIMRYMTVRYDAADLGAVALSAYWVCATLNRFCLARLINRTPLQSFAVGAVLSAVVIAAGTLSGNPVVMCVMVGLAGIVGGHFMPVLISEFAIGYEGKTAFTTSFLMVVMGIARIIAPLMMAYVTSSISPSASMMIPTAAALATAAFGWLAPRSNSECGMRNSE